MTRTILLTAMLSLPFALPANEAPRRFGIDAPQLAKLGQWKGFQRSQNAGLELLQALPANLP